MRFVKSIYRYPFTALVEYIWCALHMCYDLGAFHGKISMSYVEITSVYVLHIEVFMHRSQYIIAQRLKNSIRIISISSSSSYTVCLSLLEDVSYSNRRFNP